MQVWENGGHELYEYPAGAESFPAADNLIELDGRKWRSLLKE